MYYIHKHEVELVYGGPEEGGWHYDTGTPVEDWDTPAYCFDSEEAAYVVCRAMNAQERERRKEEEGYDYLSVLAYESTHYSYSVEETTQMVSYPDHRPHYE